MSSLLITGGAGFIGSNLVRMAVGLGETVITLDALTYAGARANLRVLDDHPGHIFIHGSISDRKLVRSILSEHKPRAVINLAAETHVDRSIDGPDCFVHTNIVGAFDLLETTRRHVASLPKKEADNFRFLHISTDEVFGSVDEGAAVEGRAYAPSSPYAASKAGADHLVMAYFKTYGLPVLISRCTNNYGPYQFPEKLIPLMIANALEEKSLPVYGDGGHVRDWIHVEDHCRAILAVAANGAPGETYNVSGETRCSNIRLVRLLCSILDRLRPRPGGGSHEALITRVRDRPGHDRRYALDATKLRNELDWRAQHSLDKGINMTVNWYLDNMDWWRDIRNTGYDGQRLGLGDGEE